VFLKKEASENICA